MTVVLFDYESISLQIACAQSHALAAIRAELLGDKPDAFLTETILFLSLLK